MKKNKNNFKIFLKNCHNYNCDIALLADPAAMERSGDLARSAELAPISAALQWERLTKKSSLMVHVPEPKYAACESERFVHFLIAILLL